MPLPSPRNLSRILRRLAVTATTVVLAQALAAVAHAGTASAAVSFDDLPAGKLVRAQYSATEGVTFSGCDFTVRADATARSAPHVGEYGCPDLPVFALTGDFTSGRSRVRAGVKLPAGSPHTTDAVTMVGYDRSGTEVARNRTDLSSTTWNEATLSSPATTAIHRVTLDAGGIDRMLVDDLDSDGPPHPQVPVFAVSPETVGFSDTVVGRRSPPAVVRIINDGTAPLHVRATRLFGLHPGDFRIDDDRCVGAAVAPGGACAVTLFFAPTAGGPRFADLIVEDDATDAPHIVQLRGGAPQPPQAYVRWEMAPRFGLDANRNGFMDEPNSRAYVYPGKAYSVAVDGCYSHPGSSGSRVVSYVWAWSGQGDDGTLTTGTCRTRLPLMSAGMHDLRLTIVTEDGQQATVSQRLDVRDILIVSIGDSIASGEGNPSAGWAPGRRARWADGAGFGEPAYACHRSVRSSHARAALEAEKGDPHSSVTFLHVACSGASINVGLLGSYRGREPKKGQVFAPQLQQVKDLVCLTPRCDSGRRIDALLLSTGANDLGFGPIMRECMTAFDCHVGKARRMFREGVAGLPDAFRVLGDALHRDYRLPADRVLLTEYPDPTTNSRGRVGTMLPGIGKAESRWAHNVVVPGLNRAIRAAVAAEMAIPRPVGRRWFYVDDISQRFIGHGYSSCCGRYIIRWYESRALQGNLDGALHPNQGGHNVYRDRLLRSLRSFVW